MRTKPGSPVVAITLAAIASMGISGCGGSDDAPATPVSLTAQQACDVVKGKSAGGASVTDASMVAATGADPAYCKVSALISPQLEMQVQLPDNWNGKLLYAGGGGYDGSIQNYLWSGPEVLKAGYAIVQSNGGHIGTSAVDASFASDPFLASMFGSGSVPTAAAAAKDMLHLIYGKAPDQSYYEGCSNGGREGLMAIQRNPDLFDGVIVRAPAYDWPAFMGAFNRNAKAVAAPGAAFTTGKISLLAKAIRDKCDAADGIVDGVVSNQSACNFDPSVLRCPSGTDAGDSCLSDAQIAAANTWTSTSSFANGTYTYPGWALTGNEDDPGGWSQWFTGPTGNGSGSLQSLLQDATVKSYLTNDANANSLAYDWNSNPAALFTMAALNSATNADLSPFVSHGGKLLLWHGTADMALSHRATTAYYQKLQATMGASAVSAFARYYQAPGVNHCSGGPGADSANLVAALDQWVTKGKAPGNLVASKLNTDGSVAFTRPLCQYPQYPRYTGPANDAKAAMLDTNYTCTSP